MQACSVNFQKLRTVNSPRQSVWRRECGPYAYAPEPRHLG